MKVLLVSYQFPPVGGAGVARVLKLAKYLPELGIEPSILTVANPSVPVIDLSRESDLRPGTRVIRASTLEPGYWAKRSVWSAAADRKPSLWGRLRQILSGAARLVLVPDPQVLWQPGAHVALRRELRQHHPDVIVISAPPFSQFLLAPLVRLHAGTALVLDYRDEWMTASHGFEMSNRLARSVARVLEPFLLRRADAVTTATPAFRDALLEKYPFLDPSVVHAIPNGFDTDDFPSELPALPTDRFAATYAGTIFRLTSPEGLLRAVRRLHGAAPDIARSLELTFVGRVVETEEHWFEGTASLGVRRVPYVPHREALALTAGSHLNVCILADVHGTSRVLPQKIFELGYVGRPVLTLAPPGSLADLARDLALGPVIHPDDDRAIAVELERQLREFQAGRAPTPGSSDLSAFDRRAIAARFAKAFEAAAGRARLRGSVRPQIG